MLFITFFGTSPPELRLLSPLRRLSHTACFGAVGDLTISMSTGIYAIQGVWGLVSKEGIWGSTWGDKINIRNDSSEVNRYNMDIGTGSSSG